MPHTSLPVEHLGTLTAVTRKAPRVTVPGGPAGTRSVVTVTSAHFVGPRITADMVPGTAAGDWLTVRPNGTAQLDVRLCLRTDDGADVFVQYHGLAVTDSEGASSIRTAPRFETGDERYAWLNDTFVVGVGNTTDDGVSYELYAL